MFVFATLALAGFIVLVIGSIFGHDHDFGHDLDHGLDHDVDHDGTISIFSMRVIATFIMGFGAAGFTCSWKYQSSALFSSLMGILFGVVLACFMYFLLWILAKQQGTSSQGLATLINKEGAITIGIEPKGKGEVGISANENYCSYVAVSKDGEKIDKGARVRVVNVAGNELVVERVY